VARQATIQNAMSLRDINLIGVYGTERDRRALVRLPSGRYVKVKVGDRLDGGQIAAIGRDELRYIKGGRNVTLEVPG
jgi:ribosomal protein L2